MRGRACGDTGRRQPWTNQAEASGEIIPVNHLGLGLPACRRVNSIEVCCVSQPVAVFCYGSPSKRIEILLKNGDNSCPSVLGFGF